MLLHLVPSREERERTLLHVWVDGIVATEPPAEPLPDATRALVAQLIYREIWQAAVPVLAEEGLTLEDLRRAYVERFGRAPRDVSPDLPSL